MIGVHGACIESCIAYLDVSFSSGSFLFSSFFLDQSLTLFFLFVLLFAILHGIEIHVLLFSLIILLPPQTLVSDIQPTRQMTWDFFFPTTILCMEMEIAYIDRYN